MLLSHQSSGNSVVDKAMRVGWGGVGWGMGGVDEWEATWPWRVKTGWLRGEGLTLEPEELMGRPKQRRYF